MEFNDNGQKVEVIVNHQGEVNGEISVVNVFSNMAKKKKVYLRLLAILLIIGLVLPMFLAEIGTKAPDTQAAVMLRFMDTDPETGEEINPQPVSFTSYVLQEALNNTQLSTEISLTNLESNIKIEQLLTTETRQRLEILDKEIAASATRVSQATSIKLDYENTFIVSLSNGFGSPEARSKTYLTTSEIQDLLNNIIRAYNSQLYKTRSDFSLPESDLASLQSNDLDFLENLDIIKTSLTSLKDYCDSKAKLYPDYRSASTGMSFQDLSDIIATVNDIDISYLYSYIMYNGITQDQATLINKYNYTLRTARLDLADVNSRIEGNKKIIDEYQNQVISVIGGDDQSGKPVSITTDNYNKLVLTQTELFETKADLESQIADLENKIKVFGEAASTTEVETVRQEYERVYNDAVSVQDLVLAQGDELLNSDTVKNSYIVSTTAQSKTTSFFSTKNIKRAVIGGAAGVIIAVCIWFIASLAAEIRKKGRENG